MAIARVEKIAQNEYWRLFIFASIVGTIEV